jgi:uncharacterized protein (TIGR02466 family)
MRSPKIEALFPTLIYRAQIPRVTQLNRGLAAAAEWLAENDRDGRHWCTKHGYAGYTSYASIHDLPETDDAFARLKKIVEQHSARFAKALHWDLKGGRPLCDSIWVNVLPEGGSHTGHIHTNAVLSGTYYVTVPKGSAPLVFEDPRHALMMAAPPRTKNAPRQHQSYVSTPPASGTLILWESWLRHEVPLNRSREPRISISFNCVIGPPRGSR